ncbi:unnamed protein product [Calypogeia fissa]
MSINGSNKLQRKSEGMLEDPKIVVGIDFRTTFSGFAYALMSDPEKVYTFYDWPSQATAGAKPYCKTQTSLWYNDNSELQDWGWPAYVNHNKALQSINAKTKGSTSASRRNLFFACGFFFTKFKLHLAAVGSAADTKPQAGLLEGLSLGFPPERLISDYLRQLSIFIMAELKNKFGGYIVKTDIQWCLTVPAIWNDAAKQTMLNCSQRAGLVQGRLCTDKDASAHPITIVLGPEAASVCCQLKLKESQFRKGSKFLVVDAGGGTVDLVVHEKVDDSGVRVKEVACSTGDLCGGTFVDKAFMDYLAGKIDGFEKFCSEYPATALTIKGYWENLKCGFSGTPDPYSLELPAKLTAVWEANKKTSGMECLDAAQYDEVVITGEDMKMIFEGEVTKILKLIADQLALAPGGVEAIMVVGGFSNSPYLMKRIRDRFSSTVQHIISPTDPGSAVCQGAVAFGTQGPDIMMSRKSRKTYGIAASRAFRKGDPTSSLKFDDRGRARCNTHFSVFTRIGDDVPVNHHVSHPFSPIDKAATGLRITMYSTTNPGPEYVTEPGVTEVGSWTFPLTLEAQRMEEWPSVEIMMYFGRTLIEVFVEPKNFLGEKVSMFSVSFERDLF